MPNAKSLESRRRAADFSVDCFSHSGCTSSRLRTPANASLLCRGIWQCCELRTGRYAARASFSAGISQLSLARVRLSRVCSPSASLVSFEGVGSAHGTLHVGVVCHYHPYRDSIDPVLNAGTPAATKPRGVRRLPLRGARRPSPRPTPTRSHLFRQSATRASPAVWFPSPSSVLETALAII